MADYSEVVEAIVDAIEGYTEKSFEHIDRCNWINQREGTVPESLKGKSFSVKIDAFRKAEDEESDNVGELSVNVQFLLDAEKNIYLNDLGYVQAAVQELYSVDYEDFLLIKAKAYFTVEMIDKFVLVDFDNLYFIIAE